MKEKNIRKIIIAFIIVILCISGCIIFKVTNCNLKNSASKNDFQEQTTQPENSNENLINEEKAQQEKEQQEKAQQDKEYQDCMDKPYKSEHLDKDFADLFESYKNENIGIYITEINNEYEYFMNQNKAYYSGCTIKILDAIYYIEKVRKGEFTGQETITYLPQDKRVFSDHMDKHNFYEEIPVTKLLEYMMTISDNTSHFMFIRHYGASNINNYFKENHNLTLPFTTVHPFISNYTPKLANETLKMLYEVLKVDDEYSKLIKEAMNNEEVNALNFDNLKFLHKYGELAPYHNDIGIYDSNNPYLISILTTYANDDYMGLIADIHRNIYNIYAKNLEEKEKYCQKAYN